MRRYTAHVLIVTAVAFLTVGTGCIIRTRPAHQHHHSTVHHRGHPHGGPPGQHKKHHKKHKKHKKHHKH